VSRTATIDQREVEVRAGNVLLSGTLSTPDAPGGLILFAHGSGSSRHSPRNQYVARMLQQRGFATLLMDLLTMEEEILDQRTAGLRFDVALLASRLTGATEWLSTSEHVVDLDVGLFGASTGAAAALMAAAERPDRISAVVSRGGRPDLAGEALPLVRSPTLLLVGSRDEPVLGMNREAMARMTAPVELEVVEGASHLFEEPGTLDRVAGLASDWFGKHLSERRR
jgi:putative phosphoribosyl transferase